jgi:HSP20 family protein
MPHGRGRPRHRRGFAGPDDLHQRQENFAMALFDDAFGALLEFQQALDTLRSSTWLAPSPSGGGAYPPLNVFSKGDDIVIIAEVPGVHSSALQVQVKGSTLRIAGTKETPYGDEASIHRRERLAGKFDRAITLPVEIDADGVKAECRDGILAVFLPRAARDKPRSVRIN